MATANKLMIEGELTSDEKDFGNSGFRINDSDMTLLRLTDNIILKNSKAWVDQGTLLGLVRDGKLIEWDNDIDLSCMQHDRPRLRLTDVKKLMDKGLVVLTSRFGINLKSLNSDEDIKKVDLTFIYGKNGRYLKSYSDFEHQNFLAKVIEKTIKEVLGLVQRSRRNGLRLGLWMLANSISWFYRSYFMKTIDMECPEWQFDLDKTKLMEEIENIQIYTSPEQYLIHKYGKDWRVPKKDWDYTTQDGGILHEKN